jgi:hypothetical protein
MNDSKYICIVAIVFILSVSSCTVVKHDLGRDMVNKGANPLEVNCLLWQSDTSCAILATKK